MTDLAKRVATLWLQATTSKPNKCPTTELWQATHEALSQGRWSQAQRLLDDLGRRSDNRNLLSSPEAYGVPSVLYEVISDRIELVNEKVEE